MTYLLRWPDRSETWCYSPSLVIRDFVETGRSYPLDDFLKRMREALEIASLRVAAKYGFRCSRADGQLAEIERIAARFVAMPPAGPPPEVTVLRFGGSSCEVR